MAARRSLFFYLAVVLVCSNAALLEPFEMMMGVRQVDVFSVLLFNIALEANVRETGKSGRVYPRNDDAMHLVFVDDDVVKSRSKALMALTFIDKTAANFIVVSVLVQETEARRKILRGRKALTRSHYRGTAIPAWAISVIVGVVMLIIGGIVYAVMRKVVLGGESDSARINYQPAMQNDP